ncbi:MAG: DUF3276 family protein [Bacteroidia bacterium]|nr:DUF3276 family protein [Bacteroidia bacterium]
MQGHEQEQGKDEVYSEKIKAGKRTYFFDVRSTRSSDYYITITESKRRFNGRGYDKHKIFLYKEDFNKFLATLTHTVEYVKTELMPDYDYDEFDRRERDYDSGYEDESPDTADGVYESAHEERLSTRWED